MIDKIALGVMTVMSWIMAVGIICGTIWLVIWIVQNLMS